MVAILPVGELDAAFPRPSLNRTETNQIRQAHLLTRNENCAQNPPPSVDASTATRRHLASAAHLVDRSHRLVLRVGGERVVAARRGFARRVATGARAREKALGGSVAKAAARALSAALARRRSRRALRCVGLRAGRRASRAPLVRARRAAAAGSCRAALAAGGRGSRSRAAAPTRPGAAGSVAPLAPSRRRQGSNRGPLLL